MKKTGLILEGGGNRGIFTAGVLDYLMEQNFYVPYVAGVSAGACNAVDYVSKQIGRTKQCMIITSDDKPTMSLRYLLEKRSLIDMERIFDYYPNEKFPFDFDSYFSSKTKCELVVTNCRTGKAEYLDDREDKLRLMNIAKASSSLPFVTPMIELDGEHYLDGGIADAIPIRRSLNLGYKKNIVILTREKGYRKVRSKGSEKLSVILYKEYPEIVKLLHYRHILYNKTLDFVERLEQEGHIYVIRPDEVIVSRTEKKMERMEAFYKQGYEIAERNFDKIKEYVGI
ncbi:MAG: patatin family protein [Lachnospiraceae bacterium]